MYRYFTLKLKHRLAIACFKFPIIEQANPIGGVFCKLAYNYVKILLKSHFQKLKAGVVFK